MGVLDRFLGSGIPSSEWCDVLVSIGPFEVHGLAVIPLCFAALAIGIWGFLRVRKSGLPAYHSYSVNFGLYGIMMMCAMTTDCLTPSIPMTVWRVFSITNAALTSTIATFFGLNGLVDMNVISTTAALFIIAFFLPLYFAGWTVGMIGCDYNPSLFPTALTKFLYSGVVVIGCSTYGICQTLHLWRNGGQGLRWYVAAIVTGFLGFLPVASDNVAAFLCTYLGSKVSPYFGPEFVFFLGSDISVWCLVRYYLARGSEAHSGYKLLTVKAAY